MHATRRRVVASTRKSPLSGSLPKVSSFLSDPHSPGNHHNFVGDHGHHPSGKAGRKRPLHSVASFFSFNSVSKRSMYWAGCSTAIILLLLQSTGVFKNHRKLAGDFRDTRDPSARPVPPVAESEAVPASPERVPQRISGDPMNAAPAVAPVPDHSSPGGARFQNKTFVSSDPDELHPRSEETGASAPLDPSSQHVAGAKDKSQLYPSHHHRSNRVRPPKETESPPTLVDESVEREFLTWCRLALGIETCLEIQTFQYYDYMQALPDQDWEQDDVVDDDEQGDKATKSLPMVPVRGLAAARDIAAGEVVIRIPLQALFSVTTTIDKDPVLGPVIGLEARQRRGWNLDEPPMPAPLADDASATDDEAAVSPTLLEIPLLAVALLHHKRLGSSSSLAPYIRVLNRTPVDTMPYLWNKTKLRNLSEGIRTVARGVKRDMKAMYERVVKVLIAEHPQVFSSEAFAYENFEWAFAIVNSRHWQLPVQDMQGNPSTGRRTQARARPPIKDTADEQLPPADTPTDAWVDAANHQQEPDHEASPQPDVPGDAPAGAVPKHSFLAPLADLLNFGPPCTTGRYNRDAHTFEIVASCEFRKGQEVTFWYSDECDHVMVGLYGFMHPMIPPCPSAEEYKRSSEEWRRRAEELDMQLAESNHDLYRLDREASHLDKLLKDCDCHNYKEEIKARENRDQADKRGPGNSDTEPSRLRHEHVRGGVADREDIERRGVRKATRERDTEF